MSKRFPEKLPISQSNAPVFLLGILQRSGTNYLYNLLLMHPALGDPAPIWEDHLLYHADMLFGYVKFVSREWEIDGLDTRPLAEEVASSLGNGLLDFLQSKTKDKRLLAKTPSVHNLSLFFRLFPSARLIILVRDGRAVVESGRRSFGWMYDIAIKRWAEAADEIRAFQQGQADQPCNYLLVRYEDVYADVEKELRRIFEFLELDASQYDFEAAKNMPIVGTSDYRKFGERSLHWNPIKKAEGFAPTRRWENWGRALHKRFNHLAGAELEYFDYHPKFKDGFEVFWKLWNFCMDVFLFLLWRARKIKRSSRVMHEW